MPRWEGQLQRGVAQSKVVVGLGRVGSGQAGQGQGRARIGTG